MKVRGLCLDSVFKVCSRHTLARAHAHTFEHRRRLTTVAFWHWHVLHVLHAELATEASLPSVQWLKWIMLEPWYVYQ